MSPLTSSLSGGVGVLPLDFPGFCSPSLISASTALSRLPLSPLSTVEFRLSSGKPISRRVASFDSNPSPVTLEPKTLDGLLTRGGDTSPPWKLLIPGEMGGVMLLCCAEPFRSPNPSPLVGFGGSGGGLSSTELELPVLDRVPGLESVMNSLCSYFCLTYRSIAPSTSSISMGICGLTLRGLYDLLDSVLPMRFIFYGALAETIVRWNAVVRTSTCALSHLSMLRDLTLEMCVPSLRCSAAHRMHRKMPTCVLSASVHGY